MLGPPVSAPQAGTRTTVWRRLVRSRLALWTAFVLVHAGLVALAYFGPGLPLGDVTLVYHYWMEQAFAGTFVVGIETAWVYPILAIVPMALAAALGLGAYAETWLAMVVVLDAAAFLVLIGVRRRQARRHVAAWWWLGFLALLGPIAVGRIDAVTVPLAIVGVLLVAGRPRVASVLLSIAMWIKVWPAAIIAGLVIAGRARLKVIVAALGVSAVVIVVSLVLGSGWHVFGFVTEQTGRGLQIEAPVSTIWMWQAAAGVRDAWVYYDRQILTYQVAGPGTQVAAAIMTPLLVLVLGAIVAIGLRSATRGAPFVALFPPLALAFVTALIVVNKVGSPQYISWLAAPIIVGLLYRRRRYLVPAVMALVLAALTQLIYPYLYGWLLIAHPLLVSVLTLRNLLEVALLGWALVAVWRAAPLPRTDEVWESGSEPLERAAD